MKFKKIRIVIYSILFAYILNLNSSYLNTQIPDEVKFYHNEFMYEVSQYCTEDQYFYPKFKIEVKPLPDDVLGLCITLSNKFTIYLDKDFWDQSDHNDKLQLYFHEGVHCMFLEDHIDDPNHFMAPYYRKLSNESLYRQFRQYLKEKCK